MPPIQWEARSVNTELSRHTAPKDLGHLFYRLTSPFSASSGKKSHISRLFLTLLPTLAIQQACGVLGQSREFKSQTHFAHRKNIKA